MNSSGTYSFNFTPTQSTVQLSIAYSYFNTNANTLCFTLDSVNYTQQNGSTSNTQLVQISSKQNDKYRFGFNGQEKDNEIAGVGNHNTAEFWEYDTRVGRRWNVDPLAHKFPWQSPYCAMDNNPINKIDPDGRAAMPPDDYVFNEKGNYVRTDKNNQPDKLVIENSTTGAKQSYNFADPVADPKAIADGTINKVVFVDLKQASDMLGNAGAFDPKNRESEWSYMNKESKGGGKLDFSYSAIPSEFKGQGASADPLNTPSPMLFIASGDNYAHNHMNFGNFLWGASGHSLGFSETTLKLAAHYNSVMNSGTNGYGSQLDSKDDQLSISRGVNFSKTNQFRDRTWTPATGLSPAPTKR
jgi:RHS repeat-associated protein